METRRLRGAWSSFSALSGASLQARKDRGGRCGPSVMKSKTRAGANRRGAEEAGSEGIGMTEDVMPAGLQQVAQTLHFTFWDKSGTPATAAWAVAPDASASCTA